LTIDLFCTDYGHVPVGPDTARRLNGVRRTKTGDLDYRFKAAKHVHRVLTAWAQRKWTFEHVRFD
jgi:hypothetical protein